MPVRDPSDGDVAHDAGPPNEPWTPREEVRREPSTAGHRGDARGNGSTTAAGGADTGVGEVEEWNLRDEVKRLQGPWRFAAIAFLEIARGASRTTSWWLAPTATVALATVVLLAAMGMTAWPAYLAVVGTFVITTWAGPAPRPPGE